MNQFSLNNSCILLKTIVSRCKTINCCTNHWYHKYSHNQVPSKSWNYAVEPFWKLSAKLFNCDIHVESYDPNEYPNGDLLTIQAFDNGNLSNDAIGYEIFQDDNKRSIFISNTCSSSHNKLHILLPAAFDLDICLHGQSSIDVFNLGSIATSINNKLGDISLHNIKGESIKSQTKYGNISSTKLLQGNINLESLLGNISADKLQGPCVNVTSLKGKLVLNDVYAERFDAAMDVGDIKVKSLHGTSNITTSCGDILIGTVEGKLNAKTKQGNINVHVARSETTDLSTDSGEIFLSTVPHLPTQLDIKAVDIHMNDEFNIQNENKCESNNIQQITGNLNEGGPLTQAKALKGKVFLKHSTWLERISSFSKLST